MCAHAALIATLLIAHDTSGQTLDLGYLRMMHANACRGVQMIGEQRDRVGARLGRLAGDLPAAKQRGEDALYGALLRMQLTADSLANWEASFSEAVAIAERTCEELTATLDRESRQAQRQAETAGPVRQAELLEEARALEAEVESVQRSLSAARSGVTPLTEGQGVITRSIDSLERRAALTRSAADVVAGQVAYLERRSELIGELYRFMAEMRLFDDFGLPPTGEVEGGGSEPVSSCACDIPIPTLVPSDVQLSVGPLPGGGIDAVAQDEDDAGQRPLMVEGLERLQRELERYAATLERRADAYRESLEP